MTDCGPQKEPASLARLRAQARSHAMSEAEREEQRISFAHGNVSLSNPAVTREVVEAAAKLEASRKLCLRQQAQIEELMGLCRDMWGARRNMAYGPNATREMLEKYPWLNQP